MSKLKNMFKQAGSLLRSRHLTLGGKSAAAEDGRRTIRSLSTLERYKQALGQAGNWAHRQHGIMRIHQLTPEMASAYLRERIGQGIGQKQIDNDRNAMEFVVGKLERLRTDQKPKLTSRAYTSVQVDRITKRQAPHNSLATRIARNAGLRAHELKTLQRADEAERSDRRTWRPDLFHGRDGVLYVVTGKGGLRRHVMIDHALAAELETRRLPAAEKATDRRIFYHVAYGIGGGKAWSDSFSKASSKELGWSNGAHGLRHSYAQSRFQDLLGRWYHPDAAKQIVSQELGHFRPSIVDVYLR